MTPKRKRTFTFVGKMRDFKEILKRERENLLLNKAYHK